MIILSKYKPRRSPPPHTQIIVTLPCVGNDKYGKERHRIYFEMIVD